VGQQQKVFVLLPCLALTVDNSSSGGYLLKEEDPHPLEVWLNSGGSRKNIWGPGPSSFGRRNNG